MNKQDNTSKGGGRGIEWCTHTWNPIGGCEHACRWRMPDGTLAVCYAETVAERVAQHAYPQGFKHHYWKPKVLNQPLNLKTPSRIFLDSMSDLMGHWVPEDQIRQVLDICAKADWHTFQLLTKNAPRLTRFDFPPNVWVGVSAPPTHMLGRVLTDEQQRRYMSKAVDSLNAVNVPVKWFSIEPLSFDIAPMLEGADLQWAVIGAATDGRKTFQPEAAWVENALRVLDDMGAAVFFKGNLEWSSWREEFPTVSPVPESTAQQAAETAPETPTPPQQPTLF